jgi:eukaryotic-like serine/threonine-protein kinase
MNLGTGVQLGPYQIVGALGAGGMGEVYRARDKRLGRDVALKILPAVFVSDDDRLRRFEQEARMAGLLNHPNILTIYDVGTHEGHPYIVSELLEGETLRSRLNQGAMPPRKTVDLALQIAHGLAAAHDKGIVHRDLKPENLFITSDSRAKTLDFGLAKLKEPERRGERQCSADCGCRGYTSDAATRVDCESIRDFDIHLIHGFEGFLVIESTASLNVVAVYTAGPRGGEVASIDVEQVPERRLA